MNSFPRRGASPSALSLKGAADLLGIEPPATDLELRGIQPLERAEPDHLGFLAHRRYLAHLGESRAGALLVSRELAEEAEGDGRPLLVVEDAHQALATLLEHLYPEEDPEPDIHPTAVLGKGVRLDRKVRIAPYAVLEEGVEVGEGTVIGAHAVLGAGARVGSHAVIHPHVVIYPGTVLGDRVILHAGVRLGVDGFGYVFRDGAHRKVAQVGRCVVEEDVEIGANTTVDRGSIGETRIGGGSKLDNLVQIGHNARIGPVSILAGQVGVAGSSRIGQGVLIGGQVGIGGHLRVGDGARLAAQAGVTGDVAPGETVMGFPARPRLEFLRIRAAQGKIPDLRRRVRELERSLARLEGGPNPEGEDVESPVSE